MFYLMLYKNFEDKIFEVKKKSSNPWELEP